jgi:hypothetical protein
MIRDKEGLNKPIEKRRTIELNEIFNSHTMVWKYL